MTDETDPLMAMLNEPLEPRVRLTEAEIQEQTKLYKTLAAATLVNREPIKGDYAWQYGHLIVEMSYGTFDDTGPGRREIHVSMFGLNDEIRLPCVGATASEDFVAGCYIAKALLAKKINQIMGQIRATLEENNVPVS